MSGKNGNGKSQTLIDIPVEFGGVSIGDATARLGVRVNRKLMDLQTADGFFCERRLTGRVVLGHADDQPDQAKLFDDADHVVDSVFDTKKFSVGTKHIATGLTFQLAEIEIEELAKFSKGTGRLIVEAAVELPKEVKESSPSKINKEAPGTLKSEGPWRNVQLAELFGGQILKSLHEAGLESVGQLSDYTSSEQRLTDIPGIGPGKAANIDERMLEFWADNPQYCDGAEGAVKDAEPAAV